MSDILRQVDEELRQDRLINLWRRYRVYLIGGLILLIGSVLGYQINKSVNQSFYEEEVEKYIGSSDLVDFNQTIENLGEIEDSNQLLISGIAQIKIATLLMENGKIQESKDKLLEIINEDKTDDIITDLAIYFYLMSNLKEINLKLWDIEDGKRSAEKNTDFGDKFIELARNVYKFNDERAKIKLAINNALGSNIKEVKSYE